MRRISIGSALLLVAVMAAHPGEAHKGITSKFTYAADVYPVFLNRCGRCHIDGGVGPMSLLKYEDAFPWAESLRAELLAAAASSGTETGDFVRVAHRQLSARELDVVLDWATGGTPEGDRAGVPPPTVLTSTWADGPPSLSIQIAEPFEVPADKMDATREFVLPLAMTQPHNATAFDLLPGNPAIVRSALVSLRSADGQTRVLGTWFPRQTPVPLSLKPAVRLESGSVLLVRIHYKKTWKFEGRPMSDQSTVGFYFAD